MPSLSSIILNDAKQAIKDIDLSPLKGKHVSVVGASGIIGTYVLACLKAYGKCGRVNAVATKEPEPWRKSLTDWSWTITDVTSHSQAIVPPGDYIFFGAGYGQPAKFMADPIKTLRINTEGLFHTALSLTHCGGRLLYASSSEIYSGNTHLPYTETQIGNTTPQHPRACYIEAKRCGEAICGSLNSVGTPAVSARIALAYGPGTRPGDDRVINQFIRNALVERAINMRDAGQASRTYCYIADCVEILFNVWLHGTKPVYNVGGTSSLTIYQLAKKIADKCAASLYVPVAAESDASAPAAVGMSIDNYLDEFGPKAFYDIDYGLSRTIAWQELLYDKVR